LLLSAEDRTVSIKRENPAVFEEAKSYEKTTLEHGSSFIWSAWEFLTELECPARMRGNRSRL